MPLGAGRVLPVTVTNVEGSLTEFRGRNTQLRGSADQSIAYYVPGTPLELLRGMVFNPEHRYTIKERGELDAVVRDNTWIFGERFHITLPEAGLSRVMARVWEELGQKRSGRQVRKLDGSAGRVDCFLGRSVPHADRNKSEFLLVELKRPSLTIGRTELDQLEDYVNAIKAQPDFSHTSTF